MIYAKECDIITVRIKNGRGAERKVKKIITLILIISVLLLFAFGVSAGDDKTHVISDVSPFAVENNLDTVLHGFDEVNEGWDVDSAKDKGNVTLAERIDTFPYDMLNSDGCLIYRNDKSENGKYNTISKKYASALDLSSYTHIILMANCSIVDNAVYKIKIELKSGWRTFTSESELSPACWNGVFVDISSFEYRDETDTIKISVSYENADVPLSSFEYYIDGIMLSDNANIVNKFMYSAESYVLSDNLSVTSVGEMTITPNSYGITVDSVGFSYRTLGDANVLKVKFSTDGICMGVRLHTFDSKNTITEEKEGIFEGDSGLYTAYLPVSNTDISKIRLTFDTVGQESLSVHCIEPYSFYVSNKSDVGIDTCALNANTGEVIIRGSVLEAYQQKEIHLFANDLCDQITGEALSKQQSISKSTVSSRDFIFRIKYGDADDKGAYLYKKYTVAVKTQDGYDIVGTSKCITNPEGFNDSSTSVEQKGSGKGLYGHSISFMQEMGASDTAVWVDIGRFFDTDEEDSNKFDCGENVYYYNRDYVKDLSTSIRNFSEKGIKVTLIAFITPTDNEQLNKLLIHPDASSNAKYCAYNTADRAGLMYLRVFSEYIAKHYCAELSVNRVVFGESVGYASDNYNMGNKTLDRFIPEYAVALRTVYNAVKSYSSDTEVYTYIDDNWDRDLPFDFGLRYDNKAFLDSLRLCINDYGNINWGVAQNPYPQGEQDYFSHSDTSLDTAVDSDRISFKNINVLDAYLKGENVTYNNSARDFIIIEKSSFSLSDEQTITADYVYNCYKGLNSAASAYITDRSCNYNNAMKYVDTSLSLTAGDFATDVLGVATWETVIEGFSEEKLVKKVITQSQILPTPPEYKGGLTISDFSNGNHGWKRYGFTEKITSGMSLLDKSGLVSLTLGKVSATEKKGIVKIFDDPLDMSATPILHFGINIASLPTDVSSALLTVSFISDDLIYEVTGNIKETVWTDVYCDLSKFEGVKKIEEITILVSSNVGEFDGPQALITSIEGLSSEYDDQQLEQMFSPADQELRQLETVKKYVLPVLISVLALSLTLFIIRRIKRK